MAIREDKAKALASAAVDVVVGVVGVVGGVDVAVVLGVVDGVDGVAVVDVDGGFVVDDVTLLHSHFVVSSCGVPCRSILENTASKSLMNIEQS